MIPIKDVKPTKIGNSHYFLIPAQYINNDVININKSYNIYVNDLVIENQKPIKMNSNGHYFLIPAEHINNKALDVTKEYDLTITER